MKTRNLIIIMGVLVLVCAGIGAFLILNGTPEYKNITMNDVTMEVPDSNVTVLTQTEHYSIYNDTENGVAVYVFDSEESNLGDVSEMLSFAGIREAFQIGAQIQQENGQEFNYSDSLKVYTYLTNYTHKNVFIVTENKENMLHILSTINVDEEEDDVSLDESVNETQVKTTKTPTTKTKSNDSDIVSETIKENYQAGDGSHYREVEYKDGNFRQYDSNGKLIGSSYDSDQAQLSYLSEE